jgi:hypothetical protein
MILHSTCSFCFPFAQSQILIIFLHVLCWSIACNN